MRIFSKILVASAAILLVVALVISTFFANELYEALHRNHLPSGSPTAVALAPASDTARPVDAPAAPGEEPKLTTAEPAPAEAQASPEAHLAQAPAPSPATPASDTARPVDAPAAPGEAPQLTTAEPAPAGVAVSRPEVQESSALPAQSQAPSRQDPPASPVRAPEPTPSSDAEPALAKSFPSEAASRTPPAPVTAAPTASALGSVGPSPAEVDRLLRRGNDLLTTGDIAGARALFLRAASGSDPSALRALAQTYDPQILGTMRVRGVKPDPSKAKALYEQAEAAQKKR